MVTLDEKQAELDALQTAFDEYIVSSRDLEEELDAELTKCQNDLTKAESRNMALANQLSSISPQLTSLETQISTLTTQLQNEVQRRISAENAAEEAESTARRMEATAITSHEKTAEEKKWREEKEELYERLAFVEGEAEDWKRELEVERERFREELEEVRGDLIVANERLTKVKDEEDYNGTVSAVTNEEMSKEHQLQADERTAEQSTSEKDQEYIKTLEDELELVTEQLIEAETKLSRAQADLEEALAIANDIESGTGDTNQTERISELEDHVKALEGESSVLREELKRVKEELELLMQELAVSNEELKAVEEDRLVEVESFDNERKEYKGKVALLQSKLEQMNSERKSKDIQSKELEVALLSCEKKREELQDEVVRLEEALDISKTDCESMQKEIDELKVAFDDASSRGKVEVMEELLATRTREVDELKEEIKNLTDTNLSLKAAIAAETPKQFGEEQFEIQALKELLQDARNDLSGEREKMNEVRSSLHEKIDIVKKELEHAEAELESTRSRLAAAEDRCRRSSPSRMPVECSPRRSTNSLALSFNHSSMSTYTQDDENPSSFSEFYRSHALSRRIVPHKSKFRARSCSPTNAQRLESDAEKRIVAANMLQNTCAQLEDQNRMSASMKNHLEREIKQLQKQLLRTNSGHCRVAEEERDQASDAILMSSEDRDVEEVLKGEPEAIAAEFRALAKKNSAQKTYNAELLTRILKLQGNIQVACRIRPISEDEHRRECREVVQALSETELGCFDERTETWKSYAFDKVWGPESRQRDIFQDVEPMALSVVDGYNACIFAYGQTGSGKTYTMEGDKINGQYGISQRTIHKVFSILEDKARQHKIGFAKDEDSVDAAPYDYSIEVGMFEIYNDEVYDLLIPNIKKDSYGTNQRKSLDVKQNKDNIIEVSGLTREKATDVNEVLAVLDRGNSNRATSSTNINDQSSRSHMILQIEVTSGVGEARHKASLYLVDLAGSERVRKSEVEGKALKEAQHINKSLSALGNVMEALDQKSSHVPFRDSKLTYLLQNSLGGNSRTMMIVTVCPSNLTYDESTFALKFATRVRRINLGTAHRQISAKNLEETIKKLHSQISLLSKSKERSDGQLLTLKREKERIQDKLEKASAARTNSKEETRTLSVLRNSNHDITSRWQKEKAVREEKTLELAKTQEQLRRVQKDLTTVKRDHELLTKKMEDKESAIFELKKDLRVVKEQLNSEKIRHRRSQVVQSRIPARSTVTRITTPMTHKSSIPLLSSSSKTNGAKITSSDDTSRLSLSELDVAHIRARVLKFLEDNDPQKVNKIDKLMEKYKGRENELLEKMTVRYSKTPEKDETVSTNSTVSSKEDRPMSRQQRALESHKARMLGLKNNR